MTERERLIETLHIAAWNTNLTDKEIETIADYLLENGVLVPPCKVGDVVYARKGCFYLPHATGIKPETIIACEIIAIKETKKGKFLLLKPLIEEVFNMRSANDWFSFLAIGKTVFFSEEEAEQALRKEDEGK